MGAAPCSASAMTSRPDVSDNAPGVLASDPVRLEIGVTSPSSFVHARSCVGVSGRRVHWFG